MNTLVPEPEIPSHQGPDAQSVDPDLDVVTMAVKVPETLAHLHYWSVQMTRRAGKDEVLDAFRTSSRIALINISDGLVALNTVKELMADRGRTSRFIASKAGRPFASCRATEARLREQAPRRHRAFEDLPTASLIARIDKNMGVGDGRASDRPSTASTATNPYFV